MQKSFDIIAHRGASGYEIENSMGAFKKAVELRANFIETDIRKTRDGVLVLSHDDNLRFLTNQKKFISKSTCRDIGHIKLNNEELIPTVEDLFSIHKNEIKFNLEIKSIHTEKLIVDLVKSYDLLEQVVFSSFSLKVLNKIKRIETNARLQFIMKFPHVLNQKIYTLKKLKDMGITAINPMYSLITNDLIELTQHVGLELYPWTVNDINVVLKLKALGIDGVITDYPDILNKPVIKPLVT